MKIRIGSTKYELNKRSDKEMTQCKSIAYQDDERIEDVEIAGFTSFFDCKIDINNSYPAQTKKQTFWHEAVHAILQEVGQSELCDNEDFVESIGKQLYGFHEDNNLEKIYSFLEK